MYLAYSKKLTLDYEIIEKIEAGIELLGHEVKSLKTHHEANLTSSKVIIRGGEAYAIGISITPYQVKNTPSGYDRDRVRKLLLKKSDMSHIIHMTESKNLSTHILGLYLKGNLIKCEIVLCRRKNKHDRREDIKKKDLRRESGE